MLRYLILMLVLCLSTTTLSQNPNKPFGSKRKRVKVPNYTLFLHLHDMAIEYSTLLEFKTDSLLTDKNLEQSMRNNLFDFRSRAILSLQHVLYKSDPIIGYLDSWTFTIQLKNYLKSENARESLGTKGQQLYLSIVDNLHQEFRDLHLDLTNENPDILEVPINDFANTYPIKDNSLTRTSLTDAAAKWVGEASIGFKSGVATLTDVLRNLSDRTNYHTEFTPKLTQWYVEQSLRKLIGSDSLINYLDRSVIAVESAVQMAEDIQPMALNLTDTVLSDIERQRVNSLIYLTEERKRVIKELKYERQVILDAITRERLAMLETLAQQRELAMEQAEEIALSVTDESFTRIENLADKFFFRILILVSVLGLFGILGIVVYKKI